MNDPVLTDLIAEQAATDMLVENLTEEQWNQHLTCGWTNWTIKETIAHLAFFDEICKKLALHEVDVPDIVGLATAEKVTAGGNPVRLVEMTGEELLAHWRLTRTMMDAGFAQVDAKERLPWAPGLPMSAKSLCSARMMETWAHSVDIYRTLGKEPVVRDRISSTLFLSAQSLPQAYRIRRLEIPQTPIYFELELPSGAKWTRGDEAAENWIKGSAAEWAEVAIRRMNWRDTALDIHGDEAVRYAGIVQTYAGPADPVEEPPRRNA